MGEGANNELTFRIAGESGEGVITVAESVCRVAARLGFHLATFRTFPAEIKGGPCMMQVRTSERPISHPGDFADVLIAFNEEAVRKNLGSLREGGTLLYDLPPEVRLPEKKGIRSYAVPLRQIALETVGNQGSKNMVALGILGGLYGLPQEQLVGLMEKKFQRRGKGVLENNLKGLAAGFAYVEEHLGNLKTARFQATSRPPNLLMTGNEAAALGALAARLDCFFGYPITPSSEIMEYLAKNLPRVGGKFLQTEDEIAALAGVCGAAWTGRRAMTATSGPGLSLMAEILGLLSMTELPAVIVDSQRGGPSTGLPTKTEQSDLLLAVYGSHGEAPRLVLAPSTVRECLELVALAFELAEKYQMPAIVLLDQTLSSRIETVHTDVLSNLRQIPPQDDRGETATEYRRFRLTESGISPRVFPGTVGFEHISTGLEHNEQGDPQYDEAVHTIMSAKRHKKLEVLAKDPLVAGLASTFGRKEAEIGVIAWGSTAGPVQEAVEEALDLGIPVKAMVPKLLYPFVHTEMKPFLASTKRLIVPEMNFTGQLATLLRSTYRAPTVRLTKVKGVPFRSQEILEKIREVAETLAEDRQGSEPAVLERASG